MVIVQSVRSQRPRRKRNRSLCVCLLQAWQDAGMTLSTTSNEACKLFDATLYQVGPHPVSSGSADAVLLSRLSRVQLRLPDLRPPWPGAILRS
ncbi:hypothetical protein GDO78_006560 [Eleutherodactylus coqui]|uniref:Uncharacterized protein n=1 Tax=Eleutherodactylus coqui TaxID=57060 RepID=A0A8J6FNY6_ELECQ|nr:hypothetical protein GDO78_006560 [Eleutherodactylus coqui]